MHQSCNTLKIGTPIGQARQAVILLHGRGSSAWDIAGLATLLEAPDTVFLAPSAHQGTWYPHRFLAPIENNEPHLTFALKVIDELVEGIRSAGIPLERIGLVGFSQGACLALEYVHRNPARYQFAACLSGALIGPLSDKAIVPQEKNLQHTPVLLCCAEKDTHIPFEHVEKSAELLESQGADICRQIHPGLCHTIFQSSIDWIREQLNRGLTPPNHTETRDSQTSEDALQKLSSSS